LEEKCGGVVAKLLEMPLGANFLSMKVKKMKMMIWSS
jgi:hypothetical protein